MLATGRYFDKYGVCMFTIDTIQKLTSILINKFYLFK